MEAPALAAVDASPSDCALKTYFFFGFRYRPLRSLWSPVPVLWVGLIIAAIIRQIVIIAIVRLVRHLLKR
jgi:hypothetical protein